MEVLMYIVRNFLPLAAVIITISAIGFFLFAKYRRRHDTAGIVQYTLAGFIFGMSAGNALITIPQAIMYFGPPMMYDIIMQLGVTFTLFAVAMVIVTSTETRRDMQELLKRLDTLSESENQ